MVYATYDFYIGSFRGSRIKGGDFPRLAFLASQFLDYYTMGKAKDWPELENVKMACCALAEKYLVIEKSQDVLMEGIAETGAVKTESVGSYSVSYQTPADKVSSAESLEKNARSTLAATARQYLVGTGLLYRGRC